MTTVTSASVIVYAMSVRGLSVNGSGWSASASNRCISHHRHLLGRLRCERHALQDSPQVRTSALLRSVAGDV
jgi:hypothetical protein